MQTGDGAPGIHVVHMKQVTDALPEIAKTLHRESMHPQGTWEESAMPDTLDLADRARMSVNAMTNLCAEEHYCLAQTYVFGQSKPVRYDNWTCMLKYLRALPLMRIMSGSKQNLDVEEQAMRDVLGQISKDGFLYSPIGKDGPPSGTAYPSENGIFVQAMIAWMERDGNSEWHKWIAIMTEGLKRMKVDADHYSYIPPESSITPEGQWRWTLRGAGNNNPEYMRYVPPDEPIHDSQGQEGAVKFEQVGGIKGLMNAYRLHGDQEALDRAVKLSRFCRKPAMWNHDTDDASTPPHEHGIFTGHFHGNLHALAALLDVAAATNDMPLKQLVREGFDHARRHGAIRLGFMPSWIRPLAGRPKPALLEINEGCGSADFIILGVQLSDSGLGDYWDDVDSMVRNHFIELQATDAGLMTKAGGGSGHDAKVQGFVGGFSQTYLTANRNSMVHGCCTGNGSRALYYAWESITRFDGRVASVNLLLNRVSPWLDIASHLPYEGKVELYNKRAESAVVRIPGWIDLTSMSCDVNGAKHRPDMYGRYMVFSGLAPEDRITIEFPIQESTEQYTIGETTYTATMRGSTVVDIAPRLTDLPEHNHKYPFFMRNHLRTNKAPVHIANRFIAQKLPSIY